ncbi:MAG: agmatinase [Pseudomonadota bacterium]
MSRMQPGDQAFDHASLYGTETEMPYSGARSFMRRRLTRDLSGVDFAVLGIPADMSTSGRPGARLGPEAVRRASSQLSWGEVWPWGFDPFDRLAVVDYGDVHFRRGQVADMLAQAERVAGDILAAGCGVVGIGGDHLTTLPLLRAHAERHGPLAYIQFDAHRDTQANDAIDHGTFVHHAIQEGLIDPAASIQIGIRTFYPHDDAMTVLYRPWVREHGPAAVVREIARVVGDRPTYLSFDIDGVDPAFAPGTGTPVVDGLTPGEVFDTVRALDEVKLVGFDLVEVAPPYDPSETTALFGASVLLELFCVLAAKRV